MEYSNSDSLKSARTGEKKIVPFFVLKGVLFFLPQSQLQNTEITDTTMMDAKKQKNEKTKCWLMIADAHFTNSTWEDSFFQLLDTVSGFPMETGILFLGDIFDLWIALPGYETEEQKKFLDWCRVEKKKRDVIYLEGNHEFYVARTYANCFTYCGEDRYREGNLLWLHGDRINKKDYTYAVFRFFLRSGLVRFFLRMTGSSFGPTVARLIREHLRNVNQSRKKSFPTEQAFRFLSECPEGTTAFSGHFHRRRTETKGDNTLEMLPAYAGEEELSIYDVGTGHLTVIPAERLAEFLSFKGRAS